MPGSPIFFYPLIHQLFIKDQLYPKHYSRHWRYESPQPLRSYILANTFFAPNSSITAVTALQNFQNAFQDIISSVQEEINRLLSARLPELIVVLQTPLL